MVSAKSKVLFARLTWAECAEPALSDGAIREKFFLIAAESGSRQRTNISTLNFSPSSSLFSSSTTWKCEKRHPSKVHFPLRWCACHSCANSVFKGKSESGTEKTKQKQEEMDDCRGKRDNE